MQLDGHRLGSAVDQDAVANVRMMLQSFSQDVPVAALTPVAPAFHTAEKEVVSHAGGQRFRLELPKMESREVDALAAELGLLGDVAVSTLPDARKVLEVTTHESLDDILAICSFVLNPGRHGHHPGAAPGARRGRCGPGGTGKGAGLRFLRSAARRACSAGRGGPRLWLLPAA